MRQTSNARWGPALLGAAALALTFAACGDGDDGLQDALEATNTATTVSGGQGTPEGDTPSAGTATRASGPTVTPDPNAPSGISRSSPLPMGAGAHVAGWWIVVNSVTPDATEAIMTENSFNDPPADGNQFIMVNLSATFEGDRESAELWIDTSFAVLGPSNVAYDSFESTCGSIPDEIENLSEVFQGGTITGNMCWSVKSEDAAELLMFVDDDTSFEDDDRRWWRLSDE